jgi:hypothetical protein
MRFLVIFYLIFLDLHQWYEGNHDTNQELAAYGVFLKSKTKLFIDCEFNIIYPCPAHLPIPSYPFTSATSNKTHTHTHTHTHTPPPPPASTTTTKHKNKNKKPPHKESISLWKL